MWLFKGKYTGEAREYIRRREKKAYLIFASLLSVFIITLFGVMAIVQSDYLAVWLGAGAAIVLLTCLTFFLLYIFIQPQSTIEITNDSVNIHDINGNFSYVFYRIGKIEYYDEFIVLGKKHVLQKDLLVKGCWEDLIALFKRIEASLETDEPMYQIDSPQTQFFTAKVIEKRVDEKFECGVSVKVPVGVYHYFVVFELEENSTAEYEVSKEYYDKMEVDQIGTLVTVGGNFFDFGDGEES